MTTSKTRHLDTAIALLKGNDTAKRSRALLVSVHHDPARNEYLVQVGSRVVAEGTGDRAAATAAGQQHVERLKKLGKTVTIIIY